MKKYTCLLLCLPLLLSGCTSDEYYEDDYEHDYEAGYDKGYAEGYNEGYEEGYNLGRDDERIDPSNVLSEEEFEEYVQNILRRITDETYFIFVPCLVPLIQHACLCPWRPHR